MRAKVKPSYDIACMDAIKWMEGLDSDSVGGLFTDPPYSSGGTQRATKASSGAKYCGHVATGPDFAGELMDQRSYGAFCQMWMREALRVLKPHAYAGVFCDWRQLATVSDAFQISGFRMSGVVVWDKTEGVRPNKGAFRAQAEYVIWGTKGTKPVDGPILPGVFRHANVTRNKLHQTQKPVALMEYLMSICPPGASIMDPFMGSGTTGIAALKSGRNFSGCEIVPEIFDVARNRLESAVAK